MEHKLGIHWLRYHQDGRDLEHIERMQYRSVKPFEWMWSDRGFCADLLAAMPRDSYILARDHPLSEQKQDMWRDPEGTGTRHANEWAVKVAMGEYHLPVERTFFLGINEPDATNGDRSAIDRYNVAFLDRLKVHGLRGGAFNFSTGHPRTIDGTPHTRADYTVFEGSHQAIRRGHHIAVAHIYGTYAVPFAEGHFDRLAACPWTDVEWVIGEFGIDEHVVGGKGNVGFHQGFNGRLGDYCGWIDNTIAGIETIFPFIHSYQLYTFDYSHPWGSFDVRAIREALEGYSWQHGKAQPITSVPTMYLPTVGTGPQPVEEPKAMATGIIEPRVAQAILKIESGGRTHGSDGRIIIRFEAHIFKTYLKNDALWAQHFSTDAAKPWTNQQWRRDAGSPIWAQIHTGDQANEWAVFDFARSLNTEAACKSISMGAAQIMGFNHARVGYASAHEMFQSFQSAPMQTIGFINYCLSDGSLLDAIQRKDWRAVALKYNGPGQVDYYAGLLENAYKGG